MISYMGCRGTDGRCSVFRLTVDEARALPLRCDLWNHSPDGFQWGYGGSGPAQLALALLADALQNDELATLYHQRFKWDVVSQIRENVWGCTADNIIRWFVGETNRRMIELGELVDLNPNEEGRNGE